MLTTVFFILFQIKLPEVPEYAKMQLYMMTPLDITMTSLDDHVREFQYNQCM